MKLFIPGRKAPLAALLVACLVGFAGCTTVNVQKIPPQEGVYPAETAPDAPLVLAIPGLVVPGLPVTQEEHFGYLVQMLADKGIPSRVLYYNTPGDPVTRKAALYSPDLSIAWTRVGPDMVRELEHENERRAALGAPPVKKLIVVGYSQGGVIMSQIARGIFLKFRGEYEEFTERFGDEWTALQNDPEFKYFINALDDYVVIRNIKLQYEKMFTRSPALRRLFERSEMKIEKQLEEFMLYLADPSSKFPNIKKFEKVGNPYYPKRYEKIREYALAGKKRSKEEKKKNLDFFVNYAQYRPLLGVEPHFITCSASLFGSPSANDTFRIMKFIPFMKSIIGREYYQIKQTELGTVQQLERIETLIQEKKEGRYPLHDESHVLFILGANDEKGDGLVDQPAAHLSRHSYTLARVAHDPEEGPRLEVVEQDRLPGVTVVPLEVRHFPVKYFFGLLGSEPGSAYMVEGSPSFPYLLNFINGDLGAINKDLAGTNVILRQFMLQVSFTDATMGRFAARRQGLSDNIAINGRYYNKGSGSIVWTGYFKESGAWQELKDRIALLNPVEMIPGVRSVFAREGSPLPDDFLTDLKERSELYDFSPFLPEPDDLVGWTGFADKVELAEAVQGDGEVRLVIRLPDGGKLPITCTVYPGCISFVRIATKEGDGK